jgi:hypothetical protein
MGDRPVARLVAAALRCYPARWRRRHGTEAAELAGLLIKDGTSVVSIAVSYLAGAVREWVTPRPGRRLSTVAGALLVAACSLGVSAGLLASTGPASAASTSQAHRHVAHLHVACRTGSPAPVPVVVPATGHPRIINWAAGHDWSC